MKMLKFFLPVVLGLAACSRVNHGQLTRSEAAKKIQHMLATEEMQETCGKGIPYATKELVEVTGIVQGPLPNMARVKYIYHWNPPKVPCGDDSGVFPAQITFEKFDDGWRCKALNPRNKRDDVRRHNTQ